MARPAPCGLAPPRKAVAVLQDLRARRSDRPAQGRARGRPARLRAELVIAPRARWSGTRGSSPPPTPTSRSDVRAGDRLLIDDGLIELRVLSTDGVRVAPRWSTGGTLRRAQGDQRPRRDAPGRGESDKDRAGSRLGISPGSTSSPSRSCAAPRTSRWPRRDGARRSAVPIIAKIEKPEALERLDADHRSRRRRDGRPRRPRGRDPARARPAPPEGDLAARQTRGEARSSSRPRCSTR